MIPHVLQEGHLSAKKVWPNAREHMYWPSIDVDIVDFIRRCQECIKWSKMPKEPVQLHNIPEGRWGKLGMDYFYFSGVSYVSSDYFSKFPYMCHGCGLRRATPRNYFWPYGGWHRHGQDGSQRRLGPGWIQNTYFSSGRARTRLTGRWRALSSRYSLLTKLYTLGLPTT